jgi:hypothetical protein
MQQHGIDRERDVVLEIDGPGATPSDVDAAALLEFAAAFFQLLKANAEEHEETLSLTHVMIVDKCVAVVARPDRIDVAKRCADEAVRQISGGEPPKRGTALVDRARASVRRLPAEQRAKVFVGPWHRDVVAEPSKDPEPLDSILSIRATPIRIGGRKPAVRFRSDLEDDDFTLETTQEIARKIGAHLYHEVEIDAIVRRGSDGAIEKGKLNTFEPVETGDPRPAWREWFRSVGGDELGDEERSGYEQ